jgi:4-hydroxy-3-methylbut-2-enyl diphosphate reductase
MSAALVVVPMRVERAALGRRLPGALRVGWGPRRWAQAAATVRAALHQGVHSGLLILGTCGALTDRLSPGDLVVADELRGPDGVRRCAGAGAMAVALRRTGRTVHVGPIYTADHLVGGRAGTQRAALAATGALAVDTESAVLAGAAGGLPVLAVRAVSDTPSRPLRSVGTVRSGLSALRALHAAAPVLAAWSPTEREVG